MYLLYKRKREMLVYFYFSYVSLYKGVKILMIPNFNQ